MKVVVCALLFVATLCPAAEARVSCSNTWRDVTLSEIVTIFGPTLRVIEPGHGDDWTVCAIHPEWCSSLPCNAGTEGVGCGEVEVSTCLAVLVSQCTGGVPTARQIELVVASPCPAP